MLIVFPTHCSPGIGIRFFCLGMDITSKFPLFTISEVKTPFPGRITRSFWPFSSDCDVWRPFLLSDSF